MTPKNEQLSSFTLRGDKINNQKLNIHTAPFARRRILKDMMRGEGMRIGEAGIIKN